MEMAQELIGDNTNMIERLTAERDRSREFSKMLAEEYDNLYASYQQVEKSLSDHGFSRLDDVFAELEKVKREIDAAVMDMEEAVSYGVLCVVCSNHTHGGCSLAHFDENDNLIGECKFCWRGVCAENSGTEAGNDA